jgi:L-cysteine desulfidase
MDKVIYNNYVAILKNELIIAFGCTEPVAIAYASAKARSVLGSFPKKLELRCSGNMIKNVKSVLVPNSGGQKGIEIAAVLSLRKGHRRESTYSDYGNTPRRGALFRQKSHAGRCGRIRR